MTVWHWLTVTSQSFRCCTGLVGTWINFDTVRSCSIYWALLFSTKNGLHVHWVSTLMGNSNRQINTTQSYLVRHIRKYGIWHTLPLNNINMNPLKISSTLTVAQRLHFGSKTWHIFIQFLFILCSQSGINTPTKSFTFEGVLNDSNWAKYYSKTFSGKTGHFADCLSSPHSPDKLQPPPWLDTCSFEIGIVPWWQIQQLQTPDHPAAPTASQCNQWWGSQRLQEDGKCRCIPTLINRVREENPVQGQSLTWKGW